MAITFSSQGCKDAATNLNTSSQNLDSILNGDIVATMEKIKDIYDSKTASDLYNSFDTIKKKFPAFVQVVTNCSKYLSETVAPAYEAIEKKAAEKNNM